MRRIKITYAAGYWLLVTSCLFLAVTLSARLNDAVGQEVEASFSQVNSDSLISVYTQKMHKYLDKDNKAAEIFSFTKEGIEVYQPETDTSQKQFDFIIFWNEISWLESLSYCNPKCLANVCREKGSQRLNGKLIKDGSNCPNCKLITRSTMDGVARPLRNIGIALDPGHMAGDLETAKREKKWVEMKKPPVELIEGELTLATALILKKKLEAQGATVMLTRDQPNMSSFGIDYKKWKDSLFLKSLDSAYARGDISFEEKSYLHTKANDTEIFRRFFMLEDLHERARKINEFHPDLTLVIHYNVDETNSNWSKTSKKDYNMTFVGGSFGAEELNTPEARIEFLRLLLTDDIESSIEFSKYMIESLVQKTKVPAALDSNAVYLKDNCMNTDVKGVYCRNLTLTRKVKGIICYGESLYQDNVMECKALSKKDFKIDGMETSKRVEEVAEAYYEGIMNYVKSKNK